MKKITFFVLLAFAAAFILSSCAGQTAHVDLCTGNLTPGIRSPYQSINWERYGQFKAALHTHTTNSDGRNTFSEVIEAHYAKGFDILAITDHNLVTADWVSARNGLTQERFNEIARGEGRDGRGMLQIPYTNEQSRSNDVNSFFVNYNNSRRSTLKDTLGNIEKRGGISFLNHPGRYTGGRAGGRRGENASNNDRNIRRYVDLFMQFPSLVGMEIVNRNDRESVSDRILWDNILARTIPQGRFVWGFSNDDSHSNAGIGYSFNVFVMPENTLENFRDAMMSGSFFAVARVARRELGNTFVGTGPVPVITNIEVNDSLMSITITAQQYHTITWISNGAVIADGETILLHDHRNSICAYVRATISGPGGIVFTQPFGVVF